MTSTILELVGQSPEVDGLRWQSPQRLRIGRHGNGIEVVLNDPSISPHHAEIAQSKMGWVIRDLGSRDGTFVNGERVNGQQVKLADGDQLRFGRLAMDVSVRQSDTDAVPASTLIASPPEIDKSNTGAGLVGIKTSGSFLRVQASTARTWEQAIDVVTPAEGVGGWRDKHVRALLRAGYSVCKTTEPEQLLQSILDDTVAVLEAQRGAILLMDPPSGQLRLRCLSLSRPTLRNRGTHSHTLAERCFGLGESMLCADVQLEQDILRASSVTHGAMSTIICALLRTPRERLGVLHLDRGPLQLPFNQEEFHLADALAATVSVGIESALLVERQRQQFYQTVTALGRAVEIRDSYTANHTNRVTSYSLLLADAMRLPPSEKALLQIGTPLHDIGKIGIEDAVLRKPGTLTLGEFEHMKTHTLKGAAILETIPSLHSAIPIARHHHERWDGTGYPDGLAAEKISMIARIVAVADAFDAMTSNRPYRRALQSEQAFQELLAKSGTHFDPNCVQAFLARRAQVEAISRQPEPENNPMEALKRILTK